MERTAALQSLLQGTRGIEEPGRCCGGGGQHSARRPDFVSPLPPGPSLLFNHDSNKLQKDFLARLHRPVPLHPLPSSVSDSGSALTSGLSATEAW